MRFVLPTFALFTLAVSWAAPARGDVAAGAPPSPAQGLLQRWLEAQNKGDFDAYQALYAQTFTGVRRSGDKTVTLDRAGWLKDRARMFKKKMEVAAENPSEKKQPDGVHLTFRQTFATGTYRDAGDKELLLVDEGGALRIVHEEMKNSTLLGPQAIVIPTRDPADQERVKALLVEVSGGARGFSVPTPVAQGRQLVMAVCDEKTASDALSFYQWIDDRAVARNATQKEPGCPEPTVDSETHEGWSWPDVTEVSVGKGRLLVFAFLRDESQQGDFARHYLQSQLVALYVDDKGALRGSAGDLSPSDFAQRKGLVGDGDSVRMTEEYVDAPCDGSDRHAFEQRSRTVTFRVVGGAVKKKVSETRLKRGRCDDSERRYYR